MPYSNVFMKCQTVVKHQLLFETRLYLAAEKLDRVVKLRTAHLPAVRCSAEQSDIYNNLEGVFFVPFFKLISNPNTCWPPQQHCFEKEKKKNPRNHKQASHISPVTQQILIFLHECHDIPLQNHKRSGMIVGITAAIKNQCVCVL